MVKIMIATKPYQGQVTVDGGESIMAPVWLNIRKKQIKVATQNQLQGMTFSHWEIDGKKITEENPAVLELPTVPSNQEVEILAVWKK